jgi:Protein of unknown function (DUF3987)
MAERAAIALTGIDADLYRDAPHNGAGTHWPELDVRLVADDRIPAPPLNDDALPSGWGGWITTQAAACSCPADYVAAGLIGAASGWTGNARRVTPVAGWSEPAHLWFALVGAPSTGKTPALRPMIEVSRELEREEERAWRAQSKLAGDDAPPRPRIIAMDTSTDELQHLLSRSARGLLYVRDELAGWIGGFDRYGGNGADRAFALECWNGGDYVCDRVKYRDNPIRIEHASLAIVGAMVPDRLRDVFHDANDGLLARMIYLWPEPTPIGSLVQCSDEETRHRHEMLMTAARQLRGLTMGADRHDVPAPHALSLSVDALDLFDGLRRLAMQHARDKHGLAAGWEGKNPGRLLRLALVFQLLTWSSRGGPEPTVIAAETMIRAGRYLDYASSMLERVTAGLSIGEDEANAAAIARYLVLARAGRLNERDISRTSGFAWARDRERRKAALRILEADGWIRRPPPGMQSGRPRNDWDVAPNIHRDPGQNGQNGQNR